MVTLDTLEGVINNTLWFHYDATGDVLYLRLNSARDASTFGEETDDGFVLLTDQSTGRPVGLTIVNWWQRFGQGAALPDSLSQLQQRIEPLAHRLAA